MNSAILQKFVNISVINSFKQAGKRQITPCFSSLFLQKRNLATSKEVTVRLFLFKQLFYIIPFSFIMP
ncbi:hypothetical protein C1645_715126 [Glomus cerebriforme]|uniref:Uncharacterized protein n=1 Tax=Glomus cerebriforme TaxID=658196 RepID=A0A397SI51_9GLOM|nr:hypothetical protein C1645_715126 [Glomus cerebriforme]